MERRVRVNYSEEQGARDLLIGIIRDGAEGASAEETLEIGKATAGGPCLYLGPAGQRCNRAALASGFCRRHSSAPVDQAVSTPAVKRALAVIGALAVLWPVIADLLHELLRLLK